MTPTIMKDDRAKGKYMIRGRETTADGKIVHKRKRGCSTKCEALDYFVQYCNEYKEPETVLEEPGDILFKDLASDWLLYDKSRIKGSSFATMLSRVNVFVNIKMLEINGRKCGFL